MPKRNVAMILSWKQMHENFVMIISSKQMNENFVMRTLSDSDRTGYLSEAYKEWSTKNQDPVSEYQAATSRWKKAAAENSAVYDLSLGENFREVLPIPGNPDDRGAGR